ncbi:MAG: glucose-6-phosphate dehydrogenase assembly protein OpcA [Spirochaetales bacterium]
MRVNVADVEAELARIQLELTSSEVRASLFTIVVMSRDVERAKADDALNYLLGKRSARVIHIVNQETPESTLEVSARCFVDDERKGVCFQEIIIINGKDDAGGALGSWTPLLVRDIPTYVLWLDSVRNRSELFRHVQTQCDKLIVDSDQCMSLGDDPVELLETLASVSVTMNVPVADFAWKRLRPFRQLAADAFEGEDRLPLLREIEGVTVTGLSRPSARLYGLWLAERLGWELSSLREDADHYRIASGRPVAVAHTEGEPGCDLAITFTLSGNQTIDLIAREDGCADIEYEDGAEARELVSIPESGEILLEEVDAVYADDLYRAALKLVTNR